MTDEEKFGSLEAFYQHRKMEFFMNVEGNYSGFVCIKVPIECRPGGISQAVFESLEADCKVC